MKNKLTKKFNQRKLKGVTLLFSSDQQNQSFVININKKKLEEVLPVEVLNLIKNNKNQKVISYIKDNYKDDVTSQLNYFCNLSMFFEKQKKINEAILLISEAENLLSNNDANLFGVRQCANVYFCKGRLLKNIKEIELAIKSMNQSLYYCAFPQTNNSLGLIYQYKHDFESAFKYYNEALKIKKDYGSAIFNKATCIIDSILYAGAQKNQIKNAITLLKKVNKNQVYLNYHLGRSHFINESFKESNCKFNIFTNNYKDIDKMLLVANFILILGDLEKAFFYCEKVIKEDPKNFTAVENIASIYLIKKEYKQAISYFEKISKRSALTSLNLSVAYLMNEQCFEALKLLSPFVEKVIKNEPEETDELNKDILRQYGYLFSQLNCHSESIMIYKKYAELFELSKQEKFNNDITLAILYSNIGEYVNALQCLNTAKNLNSQRYKNDIISFINQINNSKKVDSEVKEKSNLRSNVSQVLKTVIKNKEVEISGCNKNRFVDSSSNFAFYPVLKEEAIDNKASKKIAQLVHNEKDNLWYTSTKNKYSKKGVKQKKASSNKMFSFVVTTEEKILVATHIGHAIVGANKEILYAGIIHLHEGKVRFWTNASGHYAPNQIDAEKISILTKLPINKFYPVSSILSRLENKISDPKELTLNNKDKRNSINKVI